MRYMCLIYCDEKMEAQMSKEEMDACIVEYIALTHLRQ